MEHTLGIVSTPYHLIVFLFLKNSILKDQEVDLVVTDKTAFMEEAYKRGDFDKHFHKVYFADGRKIKNPYKAPLTTLFESFFYNPTTQAILDKKLDSYDHVYFASPGMPDEIVKELAKTLILRNRKVTFHRFEDGFASYTKVPLHIVNTPGGISLYKKLFRYDVVASERELFLFEPYLAEPSLEKTDFQLKRIERSGELVHRVIQEMKDILHFKPARIDSTYLFLGQGTENGAGNVDTYRGLIREIAEKAGLSNFCMKPHPRGINDDFGDLFPVYRDNCPFELALASGEFENKTLLSYYSTACASGSILFESNATVIFLYPLAADAFNEKCDYEDYFRKLTELYDNIHVAHTKEELWKLMKLAE